MRELVALHGGRVTVESTVSRGSTFRVVIPQGFEHLPAESVSRTAAASADRRDLAAHALEASRWNKRTEPSPPSPNGDRAHVLVVDDNADLRDYMASLLAPHYDITVAADGLAALEVVRARAPSLVVSDVMMPRLDGLGLVRELRADPATASLPVILLSARAGEDSAIEGLAAGADDYVAKPFSARELLARVRTHLDLARTRKRWIAELEATNRELEAFSYSVSHDLRAPLRAIGGFSKILSEQHSAGLDEDGQACLARIRQGEQRMSTLIDDLLELSHVARASIERAPVDLGALAASVVAELRRTHPDRDVTVDIADGLHAQGDRRLLEVALVNLIGNAWKFTSRKATARIEIGRTDDVEPTFFVRDNGAGFDAAYAAKLFAPFQRLHPASEFEGTGVGLSMVQRVIHRHRGRIWAEGAVGEGATFWFSLPSA